MLCTANFFISSCIVVSCTVKQRSICRGPDAERNVRLSKCKANECSDISVAYVVVVVVVVVLLLFCCC